MSRKYFVGGNFKCNGTKESLETLIEAFKKVKSSNSEVYIFPSALHISLVQELFGNNHAGVFKVGSQNISCTGNGAFTGEISCEMLKDMGVDCSLVGHSERRQYYSETDQVVNTKVKRGLENGLKIVLCIGESLSERETGKTNDVIQKQLVEALKDVTDLSNLVIAYEPIWAIGTGVVATPEQAQEAHAFIREYVSKMYNSQVSSSLRIIYGGSVTPDNCNELIKCTDIDGFLVGGASLKPTFVNIIDSAQ
ncbi:triose-phosphate isomerase [Cryptosporidium ubiquitum]|uniref:Triosephosphate isomerase n=1 Tax=Cryptosporidium ubiquitum TaxID=857276 RepID=A0A1J4MKF4_9CRYT|nr:triose-phosphate isomerase [Cryptosporidium ubiquitum]OII74746.1 triose-phosphate isomerase [Cryptosporidium ubiquitum]